MRQGRSHVGALIGKGDRDFATSVDIEIEEAIKATLARATPEIPFLGEEEGGASLEAGTLWVLDPIDGTINFARDSPLCAISLALVTDGRPRLAVVDIPLLGERFVAVAGQGAFLNRRRIEVSTVARLGEAAVGLTDFAVGLGAATNAVQVRLMELLASSALRVRMLGSEAVDLAWVACGRLDAALMLSSSPWDVAGGILLVEEAGGNVFGEGPRFPGVGSGSTFASTPALVRPLLELLVEARRGPQGAG
jgi:myo-inositol-1(or 4)-monophosphatase